ncbi:hypothetical protein [Mucilaginibacter sp. AK015]|uniref:hypothetical protein n=1 Tax=Mucilaginibacter sp. AK015 TaxID=2723072 RepID=UPI0016207810|nr:hypothetical protein [Mucilaginibacter sp. AK015]MBB5395107.1 hypothetical protein [Mucilaginibacter sp. AK015]
MKVKRFEKILESFDEINSWSIGVKNTYTDLHHIDKAQIVEFILQGTHGDADKVDEIFRRLENVFKQVLHFFDKSNYIFKVDYKSKPVSLIRSYKGLFNHFPDSQYKEYELLTENGNSIIAGISRLTNDNFGLLYNFLYDNSCCFAISTSENILNVSFVIDMLTRFVQKDGYNRINYLKLYNERVLNNDIVYRIAGDGGDQEIILQVFAPANMQMPLVNM